MGLKIVVSDEFRFKTDPLPPLDPPKNPPFSAEVKGEEIHYL
jgi:hypothetical protein